MKQRITFVIASLILTGVMACVQKSQEPAKEAAPPASPPGQAQTPTGPEPSQAQPAPEQKKPVTRQPATQVSRTPAATSPSKAPAPSEPAKPLTPPPPPRPVNAVLPTGTPIEIRLAQALSSATAKSGDKFEGTLVQDLVIDGNLLASKGSMVAGKVSGVEGSGRVEGRAKMSLTLTEIQAGQESYPIRTNILSFEAESTKGRDAKVVGGTTGVGAIIGAIAGGKKGAAIGAVIGAGAGAGTVMATKGKEVQFEPEQRFSFKLENDVEMRIRRQ